MMTRTVLILPGWLDSGPGHWQSVWQRKHGFVRVHQADWQRPDKASWCAALEGCVADLRGPVFLAAHSLGCLLAASWARASSEKSRRLVGGALLVAPPDLAQPTTPGALRSFAASGHGHRRLPFPSIVVASRDDPYAEIARSRELAGRWGSRFVDVGARGHLNADSRLGDWPEGYRLLEALGRRV